MSANIIIATTDAEIQRCFPLMLQLRPHLVEMEFLRRIRRQQQNAGYALAFLEEAQHIRCVAGFRISECLFYGKYLYVDDLVTDSSARSQGHGRTMFRWLMGCAKDHGCSVLNLDSGVQRFDAHRFYLGQRMDISCHHFDLRLG